MTTVEKPYVKLISSDGFDFVVDRNVACLSGTIKNMLSAQFSESRENEIIFRDIRGALLSEVVRYLYYKKRYSNSTADFPEFMPPPEICLELLVVADFLDT